MEIEIGSRRIGKNSPVYFIADIAANHDGDLERALKLIRLAAAAGADAAKFQHFTAETIVSDTGFRNLGGQQSHQSAWKKSVFEVYKDASLNIEWTQILKKECDTCGISFLTSPYSKALIDAVDPFVEAYKIGSGDITWHEIIRYMGEKQKPLIIASGASSLVDVVTAMDVAFACTDKVVLMQCNTNYTASLENFKFINLGVLRCYAQMYPDVILGLSDHTPGHVTVLGAVALGARVIEKHFTDDVRRSGPDHAFSMDPDSWREMVERTRELENALGTGIKRVEENETQTVILQRRAIRSARMLSKGNAISMDDLVMLRPCPPEAIPPYDISKVIGKTLVKDIMQGEHLEWKNLA